jgi:hypothetical protein
MTDQEADRLVRRDERTDDARILLESPDAVDADWRLGWE